MSKEKSSQVQDRYSMCLTWFVIVREPYKDTARMAWLRPTRAVCSQYCDIQQRQTFKFQSKLTILEACLNDSVAVCGLA